MSLSQALSLFSSAKEINNLPLNTTPHADLDNLVIQLTALVNRQPQPFVFLKSNNNNLSSNVADGVLILNGTPVPANSRATVRDFNVNFTTVAGTIRLVILDSSGSIKIDILRGINASTNGVGETVLEEGEMLALVGQSAGAGICSVYCSGQVQRVK